MLWLYELLSFGHQQFSRVFFAVLRVFVTSNFLCSLQPQPGGAGDPCAPICSVGRAMSGPSAPSPQCEGGMGDILFFSCPERYLSPHRQVLLSVRQGRVLQVTSTGALQSASQLLLAPGKPWYVFAWQFLGPHSAFSFSKSPSWLGLTSLCPLVRRA